MSENEFLELGFKKNEWKDGNEVFTEYIIGNGEVGIEISGVTLVEITAGNGIFITVPNCNTIEDLKTLMKLLNLSK